MIIKLAFAQIWLGILGKAKIEPHVLKEKCFFCIVCDFSRFYHNCTSCGTCSIYFLSSFALHFILFRSIQLKFLRLLQILNDSFNVFSNCTLCGKMSHLFSIKWCAAVITTASLPPPPLHALYSNYIPGWPEYVKLTTSSPPSSPHNSQWWWWQKVSEKWKNKLPANQTKVPLHPLHDYSATSSIKRSLQITFSAE